MMDSILESLVNRVVAVAELVREKSGDDSTWNLENRAALGLVLAGHALTLVAELQERAGRPVRLRQPDEGRA